MSISIVCPAYSMAGRGVEMLRELLASIRMQTLTDVDVVVSDATDATDGLIGNLCIGEAFSESRQFLFKRVDGKPGAAANLNNAIDHARGDIIKPMFQDDKFIEPDSLQKIVDAFDPKCQACDGAEWIACTSRNTGLENYDHVPYPHKSLERLREGENTYGGPSAMAWRKNDLRFDESLHWLFDCEFYARMAERYGVPNLVDTPIYIRQWEGMATKTVATGSQRIADLNHVVEKYR